MTSYFRSFTASLRALPVKGHSVKATSHYFCRITAMAVVMLSLSSCQPNTSVSALQDILQRNVLNVGTVYGRTTYFQGPEGPQGFEYELAFGFAEYLGVQLQVYPFFSLQELEQQLRKHQLDISASGQALDPAMLPLGQVGPAYLQITQELVFLQGKERPRQYSDLDGSLMVVANSTHARLLRQASDEIAATVIETNEKDAEELLEQVALGELDYTVADSTLLSVLRRRYPDLSVGFTLQTLRPVSWLLNQAKDDSLLAALLDYFDKINADGSFKVLEDKYFGHVRKFDYVDTRAFIQAVDTKLPEYRDWFIEYADELDWRLLAAMSYQESHWNRKAVSPTGVKGLMMLTLGTAKDMNVTSRLDPEQSIRGGAQYFSSLLRRIPARIQEPDRIWMALAAYNIGLGHLEDARVLTQRQGGSPDLWIDVKQRLPQLRQKKYYRTTRYGYARGDEALRYVENIRRYYDTLVWLESHPNETP